MWTEYATTKEKMPVVPMYRINLRTYGIEFSSTGILLTYGNRHFVAVAAHSVLKQYSDVVEYGFTFGGPDESINATRGFRVNPCKGMRSFDPVDVGFYELTKEEAARFVERFKFISLDPDTPYLPAGTRPTLRLWGYLGRDNPFPDNGARVNARALRFVLDNNHDELASEERRKHDTRLFIKGSYPLDVVRDDAGFPIPYQSLQGMSGSAVFYQEPFFTGYREFAGLANECHVAGGAMQVFGIGTRFIIFLLTALFPGLPQPQSEVADLGMAKSVF